MLESEMKALGGKTFKFSEYNGKVVVVNLWATWCGYCRKEMPDLVELNEQYKDQGLEIIGLNVDDETPEEVEAFVREYDVPYQIGWITDEVYSILKPRGIPSTYIITRDGNFHWGVNGAVPKARLQTKIEEALAIQN